MVGKINNWLMMIRIFCVLWVFTILVVVMFSLADRVSAIEERNVALTQAQEVLESDVSDTFDLTIEALNGLQETDVMMAELIEGKMVWMQSSKE